MDDSGVTVRVWRLRLAYCWRQRQTLPSPELQELARVLRGCNHRMEMLSRSLDSTLTREAVARCVGRS
jgi:hypothetical protein